MADDRELFAPAMAAVRTMRDPIEYHGPRARLLPDDYRRVGMHRPAVRVMAERLHVGCRWPFDEQGCPCLVTALALHGDLEDAGYETDGTGPRAMATHRRALADDESPHFRSENRTPHPPARRPPAPIYENDPPQYSRTRTDWSLTPEPAKPPWVWRVSFWLTGATAWLVFAALLLPARGVSPWFAIGFGAVAGVCCLVALGLFIMGTLKPDPDLEGHADGRTD